MIVILAEKPSVARDIAKVVGARQSRQGYLEGEGYQVTWALGHLVTLPEPHELNPEWKMWKKENLPMCPQEWPLTVLPDTKSQFKVVKDLFRKCDRIICATDSGREGELIFRYIYEACRIHKPVERMWISSLTEEAIRDGLKNLKSSRVYDSLADAARARSCSDWLIGMNFSRAYAITYGEKYFVGRVQTPTLAMVVKRDIEIRDFKPQDYFELEGTFIPKPNEKYTGIYLGEDEGKPVQDLKEKRFLFNDLSKEKVVFEVQQLIGRMKAGSAKIRSVDSKESKEKPPLFYDLTELQRHANRLFGFSAAQTLETAQALYEKHKMISYPRTDSRYLSSSVAKTLPGIVNTIRSSYEGLLVPSTEIKELGSRFVNDKEVTDHHAIIPTAVDPKKVRLSDSESKIYDLICRRLLSAWQEDYVTSITTLITEIQSPVQQSLCKDLFKSQGVVIERLGWKNLEIRDLERYESALPQGLANQSHVQIHDICSKARKTKAPPHLTEGTLLTAMETAGRVIEDKELAAVLKGSGIGTPATRAAIIESLLSRKYLERKGKTLLSTELGKRLIETVHPTLKSPELTAKWEKALLEIQQKKRVKQDFMMALEKEVSVRVTEVLAANVPIRPRLNSVISLSSDQKEKVSEKILKVLIRNPKAAGKLYEEVAQQNSELKRGDFEGVLTHLAEQGKITISQETFEKEGKTISYRKVSAISKRQSQLIERKKL